MKYRSASIKKIGEIPLGVIVRGDEVCMLVKTNGKNRSTLSLLSSKNGVDFQKENRKVSIVNLNGKSENVKNCEKFSITRTPNGYVMTYIKVGKTKYENILHVARSKDLYLWQVKSELSVDEFHKTTIAYSKKNDSFELYRDGAFIRSQSSVTLSVWKDKPRILFTSRAGNFDKGVISIIGSDVVDEGLLLLYDSTVSSEKNTMLQVGAVIFDENEPKKIIWRSEIPIWQALIQGKNNYIKTAPIGFVPFGKYFFIYWLTDKNIIIAEIPAIFKHKEDAYKHPKILDRFSNNPIIEPRQFHEWEAEGTFNPTVVEDDDGVIHLLYRAIGKDGISRVGHAKSLDGISFDKRGSHPAFEPTPGFGMPVSENIQGPIGYHPAIYTSGGGWGGAEDPRAVRIDDRVYMIYVAFEGWGSIRIALTSISLDDFKAGRWKWKTPKLISPPGKINKNWILFPEKIKGKYAILHSIAPKISIEYVDDLDTFNDYINSSRKDGPQPGRKNKWDAVLRGAGPIPIKTKIGWLILYHALEKKDTGRYKLGAMILDLNNPEKILHRSAHPILSPDMHYENNGKPGVIYASGALIKGDDLYVYYGGADKVVCAAKTPLKDFLEYLVTGKAKNYKLKKLEK